MHLSLLFVQLLLLLPTGATGTRQSDGWKPLFNGRDLSGWRIHSLEKDRDRGFWKVADGALVCDSMGKGDHDYVWLVTEGTYSDFELSLEFQAFKNSPGNSGVQVRSRFDPDPRAPKGGWLDGPQVDIHPPAPWRTGLIYDETREERRWISPSLPDWNIQPSDGPSQWKFFYADETPAWNRLEILCQGTRIRTVLNGLEVTDFDGRGILDNAAHRLHNVGLSGHIALQLHDRDELLIRFRNIRIRELQSEGR